MIAFLTQYYRGLGHAMRIKYISDCLPKDSFIVIDQLMSPPIKYNTTHTYYCEETPPQEEINYFKYFSKPDKVRKRVAKLIEILNKHPTISKLVCEGFPFCRQQFAYEYFTFLEECKKRDIKIIISVRDYPWDEPQHSNIQDWVAKTINYVINYFDCKIMLHGDESYLPLMSDAIQNYNWSELSKDFIDKIIYTGYVCNPHINFHKKETNEVYISCGLNKEESFFIYRKILQSLVPNFPELQFNITLGDSNLHTKLGGDRTGKNVSIYNYIPNLSKKLETCTAFITYGGYNSTTDILKAKIPAIIIPRQDGHKLEQLIRCYKFEELDMFKVCNYYQLHRIHEFLKQILQDETFPKSHLINLEGASNSANFIANF